MATARDTGVLERVIRIASRPETIFAFFANPAGMRQRMGEAADLDPRPGGVLSVDISGHRALGEFVEVVPLTRAVFTWGWEDAASTLRPGSATATVALIPGGDGTLVRLRHLDLSAEERANHGEGWDHFIPRLVAIAEGTAS